MTEERQLEIHKTYLRIALEISKLSRAKRNKVGALIVKDNNILAYGFNGTPSGFNNCCEEIINEKEVTKKEVLHAESNALAKVTSSTQSSKGASIYITLGTCFDCAKIIIQSKIKEVYYIEEYRDSSGIELLKKANIKVKKLEI